MSDRINVYRLNSSPFVRKNSSTREEYPFIIVSCEGTKTEYEYFYQLALAIKSRKYQHTNVVLQVFPLPKKDTNSDPQSVIDLLDEFITKYGYEYEDAIMAAVIDRDDHDIERAINLCRNHKHMQIQLFLSSPCFEFFLLLHLCDNIKETYDMQKIKENQKVSANNTYLSKIIGDMTHAHKSLDFFKYYLDNIPRAQINAQQFETDIYRIKDGVGTNLHLLFEMLSGVRNTIWDSE